MTYRVFVYGTLLQGEANHRLLRDARLIRPARTPAEFDLLHLGGFPAMARGGRTAVRGEIYDVDRNLLRRLDRLEGHPHFYRRERIELEGGDSALAYLLNGAQIVGYPRIASGDWRREAEETCV